MDTITTPVYFEKDGKVASMVRQPDGRVRVTKPPGTSIADFMAEGRVITKEEYDSLA